MHGANMRYCWTWGRRLVWDGRRFALDDTGEAVRQAKQVVRAVYAEAEATQDEDRRKALAKHALRSESAQRVAGMLALAQSEPGIRSPARDGCQSLALQRAERHPEPTHRRVARPWSAGSADEVRPRDVRPRGDLPPWNAFLSKDMGGDVEMIGFLQRIAGYALTGDTREQCLFVLWGTGANGKSTFLETLRALWGDDYAMQIRPETLMIRNGDHVPNDIARLRGARLVSVRETEEGKRLAEALLKELTGGDTISARFMRSEYFDYKPEFKLFLAANHKPVIQGTDYGIWRRIRLLPFAVTIDPAEQDATLPAKLRTELPGILSWAVRGCLEWQRDGLEPPGAVTEATAAYRAESDTLAAFLAECTQQEPNAKTQAGPLYRAYTAWCEANGERAITNTLFGRRITERGVSKYKDRDKTAFYAGLRLLASDEGAGGCG